MKKILKQKLKFNQKSFLIPVATPANALRKVSSAMEQQIVPTDMTKQCAARSATFNA
jgi:hypothetical protein